MRTQRRRPVRRPALTPREVSRAESQETRNSPAARLAARPAGQCPQPMRPESCYFARMQVRATRSRGSDPEFRKISRAGLGSPQRRDPLSAVGRALPSLRSAGREPCSVMEARPRVRHLSAPQAARSGSEIGDGRMRVPRGNRGPRCYAGGRKAVPAQQCDASNSIGSARIPGTAVCGGSRRRPRPRELSVVATREQSPCIGWAWPLMRDCREDSPGGARRPPTGSRNSERRN